MGIGYQLAKNRNYYTSIIASQHNYEKTYQQDLFWLHVKIVLLIMFTFFKVIDNEQLHALQRVI